MVLSLSFQNQGVYRMNILVVTGCCLLENTSANLCHRSYINGMIKLGHTVDLLCYSKKNIEVDKGIELPPINEIYEYDGVSLYEKLAKNKKTDVNADKDTKTEKKESVKKKSIKSALMAKTKKFVRALYGIYNPSIVWFRRAKKFKSDRYYDMVVSLSYPQVSHLLTSYLVNKNHIKCGRWIQVWEDPWTTDLNNHDNRKKCFKAEKKLLKSGQEIVYVAPITLKRQQEMFSESSEKMRWLPVPLYYESEKSEYSYNENHYGYFGDYSPEIRNLVPFYNAATKIGIKVNICGSPYGLLKSNNNVNVYPRMPLNKLKAYEDNTNVIVCLFNLGGGQVPGKIYQYTGTNKIILGILDGSEEEQRIIKDYFSQFNRFIFCHNTEDSICEAIGKIEKGEFGDVKNEPIDDFSAENIVKKLIG